jgi:cyanophycinase
MVNHKHILRQFGDSMRTALSLVERRPRRRVRSAGASSLQVLESRQLLSSSMIGATAGDLAKPAAMETGQRYSLANFRIDHFDTTSQNELGYYFVDGPDGRITLREDGDPTGAPLLNSQGQPQFVRPGEPGYAAAALAEANSRVVFAQGEIGDPDITEATAEFDHDLFVGFYLIQDGTIDDWRGGEANAPDVWFSFVNANADDSNHFRRTTSQDPGYRSNVLQYKLEDSNQDNGGDSDFDDLIFSVNRNPVASEDSYAVFNSGDNFEGVPVGFKADVPGDVKNRGQGLLANDMDFRPNTPLVVSGIRLDSSYSWEPVTSGSGTTLSDPSLHGTVTVYANGGIEFVPDPTDSYWTLEEGEEAPESFAFQYQISDGLDTEWHRVYLTHGLYHRGAAPDNRQAGNRMYLLTGGTYPDSLADAKTRFFTQGSAGGDIVMLAQGIDPYDLQYRTDLVFDEYAQGTARSVTTLNITLREQANDPRLARFINGADALWMWGGAQSFYTSNWVGTLVGSSLSRAASNSVAIGGDSAGMAVLGQSAYVDLPFDSVRSTFATQRPMDERINVLRQGTGGPPFAALSNGSRSPFDGMIFDTHFSYRDRMGRLITFAARSRTMGVGVDEDTALLIEPAPRNDWRWTVYGDGAVYVVGQTRQFRGLQAVTGWTLQTSRLTTGELGVIRLDPTNTAGGILRSRVLTLAPSYRLKVTAGTVFNTNNGGDLYSLFVPQGFPLNRQTLFGNNNAGNLYG